MTRLHLLEAVDVFDGQALLWWLRVRKQIPQLLRKGFDSFFFLAGWMLWKERNARTFNASATPAPQLVLGIQEEADTWCKARFKHLASLMATL